MPIESGLQTTDNATAQGGTQAGQSAAATATTSDGTDKNTAAQGNPSGAATQAATTEAQPTEKTFTQADVDRIVANRIKSGVKAELKRLTGDADGTVSVEDLQRQLSESQGQVRAFEARQSVSDYLTDARHKLNVKPENFRAVEKLVIPDLEYDEAGKPTNLKEVVESVKSLAPALFANTPPSIDANAGRNTGSAVGSDMNALIRDRKSVV